MEFVDLYNIFHCYGLFIFDNVKMFKVKNGRPDEPSNGVKGMTLLGEHIKFPENVLIDYMHLVLEGVCKILFKKWFNSKNKNSEYYIGNNFIIYLP